MLAAALLLAASPALVAAGSASPARQDPEPGQPIIIRWSTETEVDTAGFNLYRSLSAGGPWEKINDRLIPGAPDPLLGGSYVFTDTEVIAGQTYWYELEEVETTGKVTRLQQTQAVSQPQSGIMVGGIPCGAVVLPVAALVVAVTTRRSRGSG